MIGRRIREKGQSYALPFVFQVLDQLMDVLITLGMDRYSRNRWMLHEVREIQRRLPDHQVDIDGELEMHGSYILRPEHQRRDEIPVTDIVVHSGNRHRESGDAGIPGSGIIPEGEHRRIDGGMRHGEEYRFFEGYGKNAGNPIPGCNSAVFL